LQIHREKEEEFDTQPMLAMHINGNAPNIGRSQNEMAMQCTNET